MEATVRVVSNTAEPPVSGHLKCKAKLVAYERSGHRVVNTESTDAQGIYQRKILCLRDVLMQATKFTVFWSRTVTHHSICVRG